MVFTLTTHTRGAGAVLQLAGELDLGTKNQLTERVATLINTGHPDVQVDLNGLTFIDSSGISSLLRCKRNCEQAGGSFQVVGAQDAVAAVLRITGLDQAFNGPDPAVAPAGEAVAA